MQLFKLWFSLLAVAVSVLATQPPTELQIETTFMPEECPQKAAKGDTISVHYVSSMRPSIRCRSHLHLDRHLAQGRKQIRLEVCSFVRLEHVMVTWVL